MHGPGKWLSRELREPLFGWYAPVIFTIAAASLSFILPQQFVNMYGIHLAIFAYAFSASVLTASAVLYFRRWLSKKSPVLLVAFFIIVQALIWEAFLSATLMADSPSSLPTNNWLFISLITYFVFAESFDLVVGYAMLGWISRAKGVQLAALATLLTAFRISVMSLIVLNGHPFFISIILILHSLPLSDMVMALGLASVIAYMVLHKRISGPDIHKTTVGIGAFLLLICAALLVYRFGVQGAGWTQVLAGAMVTSAIVFPFWGIVLQDEGEKRSTIRLMKMLNSYRPGLDSVQAERSDLGPQNTGLALLSVSFPGSVSFTYRSSDCRNWKLVNSFSDRGGRTPSGSFTCDMSSRFRVGEQITLLSSKPGDAMLLSGAVGGEFLAMLFMPADGEFEIMGVARPVGSGWETSEISFIHNLSWLIRSEALSYELSERQRMMTLRLLTLVETTRRLIGAKSMESLYDTACEIVTERLGYSDASIWVNLDSGGLRLEAWRFDDSISPPEVKGTTLPPGRGIVGRCAQMMTSHLARDVTSDPHYVTIFANRTRSEFAVPVVADGSCIAVLDVESSREDDFDTSDVQVLSIVSDIIAMSWKNLTLYEGISASQKASEIRANILAHDLKNMFQPISINMAILKARIGTGVPLSGDDLKLIESTTASIDNASRFVNGILQLVRLGNSSSAKPKRMSLQAVIGSASSTVTSTFSNRDVLIETRFDAPSPDVLGTELLEEVFVNLFTNSIKYNGSEKVRILVTGGKGCGSDEGKVVVGVSDNGTGIPPERIPTLFDRFSASSSGSGIGLSLVRGIVESIGGSIEASPRGEGKWSGAHFTLMLPGAPPQHRPGRTKADGDIAPGIPFRRPSR